MRVQSRRTDTFPTTNEIPIGIGLIWLLGALLALPAGQGVAFALTGRGFVWPGPELVASLGGLLTGHPGQGLRSDLEHAIPSALIVYAAAAVLELALAACALLGLSSWWRSVGPYAQFGMAHRNEVKTVLGRGPLLRRRTVIRPDLVPEARR